MADADQTVEVDGMGYVITMYTVLHGVELTNLCEKQEYEKHLFLLILNRSVTVAQLVDLVRVAETAERYEDSLVDLFIIS